MTWDTDIKGGAPPPRGDSSDHLRTSQAQPVSTLPGCPNPPPTPTHLHKKMRLDSLKDGSPGSSLTWGQGQPRGHHHPDGLAFVRGEARRLERQRGREAGSERQRGREAETLALSSRSISRMAHCHSSQVSAWHPPTPGCRMQQRKVAAKIRGNAPL